jgi:hypothetical protein
MKEGFRPVLQITITKCLHHGRNLSDNDFRKEGLGMVLNKETRLSSLPIMLFDLSANR